jgi:hypothetical protein
MRLIKSTVKATFPNVTDVALQITQAQLDAAAAARHRELHVPRSGHMPGSLWPQSSGIEAKVTPARQIRPRGSRLYLTQISLSFFADQALSSAGAEVAFRH